MGNSAYVPGSRAASFEGSIHSAEWTNNNCIRGNNEQSVVYKPLQPIMDSSLMRVLQSPILSELDSAQIGIRPPL